MLKKLIVKNFALIDSLEVDFSEGMNIITGETGAGKSILLGALSLLTGRRADSSAVMAGTGKCIVEAEFLIKESLKNWFNENDIDYESNTIIRRELKEDGKSRSFINDVPVNLAQLKDLSSHIIDIHSQHDVYALSDPNFRIDVTDCFIENKGELNDYQSLYHKYRKLKIELNDLVEENTRIQKDIDYIQFRYNELESAKLESGQKEKYEQELNLLNNAEIIATNVSQSTSILYNDELNVIGLLGQIKSLLSKLSNLSPQYLDFQNRINSVIIELKDVHSELENSLDSVKIDPERMQEMNESLGLIYKLEKIHGVSGVEALIGIQDTLSAQLSKQQMGSDKINELSAELSDMERNLHELSIRIHSERQKAAFIFENEVNQMLKELHMPDAVFQSIIKRLDEFGPNGKDEVRFQFSANKGVEAVELTKIASGGEMSRVMLSIKSSIAKRKELPTIIFDEIDTGISGKVADKAGLMMQQISKGTQVIAITHLPQIAAKGIRHFKVLKENTGQRTRSVVKQLHHEERISELAEMLSGSRLSPEAMANAKILLEG